MTVREALDLKREQLQGKVASLTLCKYELFYNLKAGEARDLSPEGSVYPVRRELAAQEAKFYGVPWSDE